ncbi:spore coat protein U domain-containing protein [Rhizobium herbae]|uniref:Spore coat protein U/FanG domain-containing protein n=1 Tax=Rhizobium herbae TaxID=508661 RepID=A0ABS4ER52_9HYPH|nr:spore coat protein U domain-containing protein [Rhizobium herbae]MBP1860417.1 hypothetical protein [Rhizobium herbae]
MQKPATVTPRDRSGVIVDLGVRTNIKALLVILQDESGAFVEAGSAAMLDRTEQPIVFGYDGQAYVTGLDAQNRLVVDQPAIGAPPPIVFLSLPLTTTTVHVPIYARILANQQTKAGGAYLSTFAGTQNPTQAGFTVQANVNRPCDVTAEGINFGNHGLITSNVDAAGKLLVTCTQTLPYAISMNGGLSDALPAQRKITRSAAPGREARYFATRP